MELDRAVTFAPSGDVVVAALSSLRKGGVVAINAIHLDRIPQFDYDRLLWGERQIRSVANMTRADARDFLDLAAEIGVSRSDHIPAGSGERCPGGDQERFRGWVRGDCSLTYRSCGLGGAGNRACRRPFRPPLGFGALRHEVRRSRRGAGTPACSADTPVGVLGRTCFSLSGEHRSPLGFQPASPEPDEFLRLRCTMPVGMKPEKMRSNCLSGPFRIDGGLKGRLQARLPAPPNRPKPRGGLSGRRRT